MSWRKGLRWNKKVHRWQSVASGRFVSKPKPTKLKPIKPKPRKPPKTARDRAYTRMLTNLEQAAERMRGAIINKKSLADNIQKPYIHKNRDGSVDAELRVLVPRGVSARDILLDLENASESLGDTFLSAGIRYTTRPDEPIYERFMGMSQASTNYTWNTKQRRLSKVTGRPLATRVENFFASRVIDTEMQKRGRRKPETVFMRIHWNKDKTRPIRKHKPKGR